MQVQARIVERQEDTQQLEAWVKFCADIGQGLQKELHTSQVRGLWLSWDNYSVSGHKTINSQQAQAGRGVNYSKVKAGQVTQRLFEHALTAKPLS